ncbi:hypothetical protein CC85DRAFT_18046 [Cutaneotrichosporon oleaginosum]|uniref:Yeast cell wall synthesis Kre9/Knh1-like N-terminal domain-containing protein n=1 Tax=Cutaneotrichosporon oleaginosum TaxID=879819 RepID=A0A0J0XTP1_9TREE|nr:uncharacterized protein CC85DRAFT_18046 [Cutaneotrichosporon oleaginosum]KLT44437.1 hypothetical protein CC85DRAFT_18046 [Cutaneotrichosporon oleaginosum]TXT07843.1 hypothetical protein COLE_04767 [Cutaneotrichosporon oleaginosum]
MFPALLAGLTLLSGAAAEIAILYPSAGATWYMNDTVPLNWTLTQPQTDPKEFRVLLSGGGMAGPQEIAQQVPSANEQYRLLLPQLNPGDGYTISFVNTTNEAQEYAKSNAFKIEQGIAPTTLSSSGAASATRSVNNNVPNVSIPPR